MQPTIICVTPAPAPPAKGDSSRGDAARALSGALYSPPPATKPKLTLEMGTIVAPSAVAMGSPTTVFTSIMSRMLSMVVVIMPSIGCLSILQASC